MKSYFVNYGEDVRAGLVVRAETRGQAKAAYCRIMEDGRDYAHFADSGQWTISTLLDAKCECCGKSRPHMKGSGVCVDCFLTAYRAGYEAGQIWLVEEVANPYPAGELYAGFVAGYEDGKQSTTRKARQRAAGGDFDFTSALPNKGRIKQNG